MDYVLNSVCETFPAENRQESRGFSDRGAGATRFEPLTGGLSSFSSEMRDKRLQLVRNGCIVFMERDELYCVHRWMTSHPMNQNVHLPIPFCQS